MTCLNIMSEQILIDVSLCIPENLNQLLLSSSTSPCHFCLFWEYLADYFEYRCVL